MCSATQVMNSTETSTAERKSLTEYVKSQRKLHISSSPFQDVTQCRLVSGYPGKSMLGNIHKGKKKPHLPYSTSLQSRKERDLNAHFIISLRNNFLRN